MHKHEGPVAASKEAVKESEAVIAKDPVLKKETSKEDKAATIMAKLADLRSNLSKEEREEYEKFRSDPKKIKLDQDNKGQDSDVIEVKPDPESSEGSKPVKKTSKLNTVGRRPAAAAMMGERGSQLEAFYKRNERSEAEHRQRSRQRIDRSRTRSRSRSRDRDSRSRRPESSRKRSDSPFSVAYENWRKYKQAERCMYETVNRKRDIFDKRPEDHPQYPEEWRIFWEKRYQEIQAQGKNADAYDYKPDWIPYWKRKVEDLYRTEVRVKTQDLMKKFNLKSDQEPKRVDFNDKPRPNGSNGMSFEIFAFHPKAQWIFSWIFVSPR